MNGQRSCNIYIHTYMRACTHTHTMENYSAIIKEILPFATTRMDLEGLS